MRKIALIPVYNEANTLVSVLDSLSRQVDGLINAGFGFWAFARWVTGRKVINHPAVALPVVTLEKS